MDFNSENSVFEINDGSVLRDISPYVLSVSGLPGAKDLRNVTALGSTGQNWKPGIHKETVISLELKWSDDSNVGPDTVFRLVGALSSATAFDYGPEGKTTGKQKYSGTCWLQDYQITSRVGNIVLARADLKVEGAVSAGTY